MVEEIGHLVEDIRVEELNLRAAELRVLQEQINPHFLYNTLDNIIWLADSKDTEQVVRMVSSLSSFFRTTLSKGREFITVKEEEQHIRSYLEIQQFRYISPFLRPYSFLRCSSFSFRSAGMICLTHYFYHVRCQNFHATCR